MQTYQIEIYRGDDTEIGIAVFDGDAPLDVSAGRLDMAIAPKVGEPARLSTEDGSIEAIGNAVLLHFTHELTRDWAFKKADYDLQYTEPDGTVRTLLRGEVVVTHDITR